MSYARGIGIRFVGEVTALLVVAVGGSTGLAEAGQPRIEFDSYPMVSCRDVTPEPFAATHPDQKIIEAQFRVSVRVKQGSEKDVEELIFEITSPDRRLRVLNYSPDTRLESDVVGNIEVCTTNEKVSSLGATIGGSISAPYGPLNVQAAPAANIGTSKRNVLKETAQKLPPLNVVVVSGTTNQEHGVFFKVKPSPQSSLEGTQEFVCRFIVPQTWRGDWARFSCRARGENKRCFFKTVELCGEATFLVGLHLEGDGDAREAAERLSEAQGFAAGSLAENRPTKDTFSQAVTDFVADTKSLVSPGKENTFRGAPAGAPASNAPAAVARHETAHGPAARLITARDGLARLSGQ